MKRIRFKHITLSLVATLIAMGLNVNNALAFDSRGITMNDLCSAADPAREPTMPYIPDDFAASPPVFGECTLCHDDGRAGGSGAGKSAFPDLDFFCPVVAMNNAPVANDDSATTNQDVAVIIAVLGNDTDTDGPDPLTVDSVMQPANGTVSNNGTDVTYTPDVGFVGTDTFTYIATDGMDVSNSATVTVEVLEVVMNVPPMAMDDSATTNQDMAVNINVLANDTDTDGPDPLTVDSVMQPANGTVSNNGTDVTYTPDAGFIGTDTFTYIATDGMDVSNSATVTVEVREVVMNVPPMAMDDSATTNQDMAVNIDVLANDTDDNGDTLAVDSVMQPANGSVVNNGTDVTYTPDAGFFGTDTFTYIASDGMAVSNSATVTVEVQEVVAGNAAPVAMDDSATTKQNMALIIDVLANDMDTDGPNPLTVFSVTPPANGSVSNNTTDVTYTPDADFFGSDTFTYMATDGMDMSNPATVTVEVQEIPMDPPMDECGDDHSSDDHSSDDHSSDDSSSDDHDSCDDKSRDHKSGGKNKR